MMVPLSSLPPTPHYRHRAMDPSGVPSLPCPHVGVMSWEWAPQAVCLCPVWQLLEIQAQYHQQSLESLDSALAELRESHRQTGTPWLSMQPGKGCS